MKTSAKSQSSTPSRSLRLRSQRSRASRLGAAAVEFAVIAPVMIMLTMGMIEVGRMVMVKQVMINASRDGARLASLPESTSSEVIARVQSELTSANIPNVQVSVTPSDLATATAGTQVKVELTVAASQVSWVPHPLFSLSKNIVASTSMRRESN
jgi:Flp pilus assembly protein TadG